MLAEVTRAGIFCASETGSAPLHDAASLAGKREHHDFALGAHDIDDLKTGIPAVYFLEPGIDRILHDLPVARI